MKPAPEAGTAQVSQAGFSAEWQLLLAACSESPSKEERIRALAQSPIGWSTLFSLADRHGVACLLHQALASCGEFVPGSDMHKLNECYETNLRKTLLIARELFRVLDCLDSLQIEVLPYKGIVLAQSFYRDIALRQAGDIDLLVRAKDVSRIKDALRNLGYTPNLLLSKNEERAYLRSGYEYTFDSTAGKNLLEIQWAIEPRFYSVNFDLGTVFRGAVPLTVAGREIKTPAPEDLALILAIHAAKHLWTRLIWLCDFARLMHLRAVNWPAIERRARSLGILRILRVTLLLSQNLLEAPLPRAVAEEIQCDDDSQSWTRSIADQIIGASSPRVDSTEYFRQTMRLRERASDRFRFIWRLAITPGPSEWKSVRLPETLFPLYRMVRLSRLAARLAGR